MFVGSSWLYDSWIYNFLCNQCLSPLKLWVRTCSWLGVLDTIFCDKVCQWLATGQWYSLVIPVSSTNKTDHHDITEMLLKVTLNTINPNPLWFDCMPKSYNLQFFRYQNTWWRLFKKKRHVHLIRYLLFLSDGDLFITESIIRPVASASALT